MIFDLHAHTTFSDGVDSPSKVQFLMGADNRYFTITDHDKLGIHLTSKSNCSFTGIEIRAKVGQLQIEVLCYGFDVRKAIGHPLLEIMEAYDKHEGVILSALLKQCEVSGYRYTPNLEIGESGMASRTLFADLNKYPENREKCPALKQDTGAFYRYNTDPTSDLYVQACISECPTLEDVRGFVEDCGGLLFLAHPFVYIMTMLERVNLLAAVTPFVDGIECMHRSANRTECMFLISYCKLAGLKISGGSDYHGGRRGDYIGTPYLDLVDLFNLNDELLWIKDMSKDILAY